MPIIYNEDFKEKAITSAVAAECSPPRLTKHSIKFLEYLGYKVNKNVKSPRIYKN